MTTRADVEYQISGLDQELRDGLERLEHSGQTADRGAVYRRAFDDYIQRLRRELESPAPDVNEVAVVAMQAAWLARIWPILQSARLQWRGPDNLRKKNSDQQKAAAKQKQRCLDIASELKSRAPAKVRDRYIEKHPEKTVPSTRTIRRYLSSKETDLK